MNKEITYSARERNPGQNNLMRINETLGLLLTRLGGKVINSSYMLSERMPVEAYGYYHFSNLGIIRTFLKSNNSGYLFSVNFSGFEADIEKYNKLKNYIEETLKKIL